MNTKKTIFQQRLKSLYEGLDNESKATFRNEVLRNKDRYYNLVKNGANPPHIEEVRRIADYFKVDTGYMLGDYDYSNITVIHPSEIIGISKESCNVIQKEIGSSVVIKDTFEKLITDPRFVKLLYQIYRYSHSYNNKIVISDTAEMYDDDTICDPEIVSSFIKNSAIDLFNDIIKSIYESNIDELKGVKEARLTQKLLEHLLEYKRLLDRATDKESLRQDIYKIIENDLAEIRELNNELQIIKYSPQTLLDNASYLYHSYTDDYPYNQFDEDMLKELQN